jgi:mevalonate kinase
MTGFENLKLKLLELGATKQQVESRAVELTILALTEEQNGGAVNLNSIFTDILTQHKRATEKLIIESDKYTQKTIDLANIERQIKELKQQEETATLEIYQAIDEIKSILEEVLEPETAEGRDKLRALHTLEQHTEINTVYDNTAFIRAAGNILSGIIDSTPITVNTKTAKNAQIGKSANINSRLDGIKSKLMRLTANQGKKRL